MSIFKKLNEYTTNVFSGFLKDIQRANSKSSVDAMLAGIALTISADGNFSPEERRSVRAILRESRLTAVFDSGECLQQIEKYLDMLESNYNVGVINLLQIIRQAVVNDTTDVARVILRVCVSLVGINGLPTAEDLRVLGKIANELNLDLREFMGDRHFPPQITIESRPASAQDYRTPRPTPLASASVSGTRIRPAPSLIEQPSGQSRGDRLSRIKLGNK